MFVMLADCVHSEGPQSDSSMLQANIVQGKLLAHRDVDVIR